MKSPNRGAGNRSLLNHAGKGSADRTTDAQSFRSNYGEINFDGITYGIETTPYGFRKVYGPRAEKSYGPHIRIS